MRINQLLRGCYFSMLCVCAFLGAQSKFFVNKNRLEIPINIGKPGKSKIGIDPLNSQTWGLHAIGFYNSFTLLINPKGNVKRCNPNVTVAILDTGIDYTHKDLLSNLWVNTKETPNNNKDDDQNGFIDDYIGWDFVENSQYPFDREGHGTHVASIIGAAGGNSIGISGICDHASLLALKYTNGFLTGTDTLTNTIKALKYAISAKVKIINYSGGGTEPSAEEMSAIQLAKRQGILVIASAGNNGYDLDIAPYYPAAYDLDNIITVSSYDRKHRILISSNFGKKVDIAAPGLDIVGADINSSYKMLSGTSQATAFVTGAAALLFSQRADADYLWVKYCLTSTAEPLKQTKLLGLRVDLAIKCIQKPRPSMLKLNR